MFLKIFSWCSSITTSLFFLTEFTNLLPAHNRFSYFGMMKISLYSHLNVFHLVRILRSCRLKILARVVERLAARLKRIQVALPKKISAAWFKIRFVARSNKKLECSLKTVQCASYFFFKPRTFSKDGFSKNYKLNQRS